MFLTHEELIELTGRKVRSAQARALNLMGVTHRRRPDGSVAVLKSHVEKLLDGNIENPVKDTEWKPDWNTVR